MTDAETVTQKAASNRWLGVAGSQFRVTLPGHPSVILPADDKAHAIRRYNRLCGITAVNGVQHHVELLEEYPHPLPEE